MAIPVEMPKMSDTMEEGVLAAWLKEEGDTISAGDVVAQVETDKATMDLEVYDDGVLLKRVIEEGDSIPIGGLIAILGKAGEDVSAILASYSGGSAPVAPAEAPAPAAVEESAPVVPQSAPVAPAPVVAPAPAPIVEGRIKASPLARKLAKDKGIDLALLQGSGPEGRIVKRDIEAALVSASAPAPQAAPQVQAPAPQVAAQAASMVPAASGDSYESVRISQMRKTIAKRLAEKGAQVFAFDDNEEKIEQIKDQVAFAVTLDSTDIKALQAQNVGELDAVVVAIGENFEATILTCVHMLDLCVKRIIARSSGDQQKLILEKIGVTEILMPEDEVAFVVREKLINPSILSFLQLPDDYEIAEIIAPKGILGRSIDNIEFRNHYELTLVTIKREFDINKKGVDCVEQHVLGVPSSDTQIMERDTLVVFGTSKNVQRFMDINEL